MVGDFSGAVWCVMVFIHFLLVFSFLAFAVFASRQSLQFEARFFFAYFYNVCLMRTGLGAKSKYLNWHEDQLRF